MNEYLIGKMVTWARFDRDEQPGKNTSGRVIGVISAGVIPTTFMRRVGLDLNCHTSFRNYKAQNDRYLILVDTVRPDNLVTYTAIKVGARMQVLDEDGKPLVTKFPSCPRCKSNSTGALAGRPGMFECYVCGHQY